jgi:pimeloyl-ACP methyl ester carboxylesterase
VFGGNQLAQSSQIRDITVDGKRLETFRHPATQANTPTIVMLHEGLGSIALWKDFPEQVAAATGCGVLIYSRYGHGKSDRLAEPRGTNFMHREAHIVLPELLRHFAIENPILLGHSDGASISLIYAGTHPSRVGALILEAPHVFVEEFGLRSTVAIRTLYESTDLRQKLVRYHDHVDEMFRGWNDIWLAPEFRRWNIEEYLPRITCPILVIQGENDEYGTIAHLETIQRQTRATQALILPGCGHSPHRERPTETLAAVTSFVKKIVG